MMSESRVATEPCVSTLALPDSGIRVASPALDDPRLDAFSCGSDEWAEEVNDEIRSRDWLEDDDLRQYLIDDVDVAYARIVFARYRHPTRSSSSRAKYLALLAFGVSEQAHGGRDPGNTTRSIAGTVLEYVRQTAAADPDCVGVSLHVREPNIHAREVYDHFRYVEDPDGVFLEGGLRTVEMRLIFGAESTETS